MEDINIRTNTNSVQNNNTINRIDTAKQAEKIRPLNEERLPRSEEIKKKESEPNLSLENVVSVSEDGDTVQVTEESSERLEEDAFGRMIEKEDVRESDNKPSPAEERLAKLEQEQAEAKAARRQQMIKEILTEDENEEQEKEVEEKEVEEKEVETDQINSFNGYTYAQLEKLVSEGRISRDDYEKEMDSRSEKIEELKENGKEFNRTMVKNIAEEEQGERDEKQIRQIFSPDASDTLTAETRADIIESLQDFNLNN